MKKCKNILWYSLCFVSIMTIICLIFNANGKTFVWKTDGLRQHIMTLYSFKDVLLNYIKTGHLTTFSWNLLGGIDMFGNYAYYIVGDFLSYISILFPKTMLVDLYDALVVIRWYLVGLSFLFFCKYKKFNDFSSVVGSLLYAFCTFSLYALVRHPYFANALILFPLLMIGIEKIILEDKKVFYTLIITIMYISSFYFGYMMSLIAAIYGLLLIFEKYKADGYKVVIKKALKVLLFSLLGIGISAVITLPTLFQYFGSERIADNTIYPYKLGYYRDFFNHFLDVRAGSYWVFCGVQSIFIMTLPFFFKKRDEHKSLFTLFIILLFPILFSKVGSIFCGFSYPNNRWTYVIAFIFSYSTAFFLNSNPKFDLKEISKILLIIGVFLLTNYLFDINVSLNVAVQISLLLMMMIIYILKDDKKMIVNRCFKTVITILVVLGIILNAKYLYDLNGEDYVNDFLNIEEKETVFSTSNNSIEDFEDAVNYINKKDKGFYKIIKSPYNLENMGLIYDFNSNGSYYSMLPLSYQNLNNDIANSKYALSVGPNEYDNRTKINSLLGVKYLIASGKTIVPYGYTQVKGYKGPSKIYKNNNTVKFASLYNKYITPEEYEKLNPVQKEASLLKNVVVSDKVEGLVHNNGDYEVEEIPFEIDDKKGILNKNNIEIKKEAGNYFTLNISPIENKEIYVSIKGLKFEPYNKKEMIDNYLENNFEQPYKKHDINKANLKYKWYQTNYSFDLTIKAKDIKKKISVNDITNSAYYFERDNFLVNLGYYETFEGTIKISLSRLGRYTFDEITVYAMSFDNYEDDIKLLNESNLKIKKREGNKLSGTINPTSDAILQFNTFYNKGWKVYIDNKKVDTFKTNNYFLGIKVKTGKHKIKMVYQTPYFKEGKIVTLVSIIVFASLLIYEKKKGYLYGKKNK